jgi:anti-sigma B factor antagonist
MAEKHHHNPKDMDVVYLGGRLDCNTAPDLEDALNNLIDTSHIRLVINCKDLEFIDEAGARTIYTALCKVKTMDGDIRVACLNPELKDSMETELTSSITFFDTEDAAISSYL